MAKARTIFPEQSFREMTNDRPYQQDRPRTGASRGIGRASAARLAEAGARVIVHYSASQAKADELVAEIRAKGGQADAIGADLPPPMAAKAGRRRKGPRHIPARHLVNNAGVAELAPFDAQGVEISTASSRSMCARPIS